MQLYRKQQAIERMNNLSAQRKPFLFIIDYEQNASYIEEIANIDPSHVLYQINGFSNAPIPPFHPIDSANPSDFPNPFGQSDSPGSTVPTAPTVAPLPVTRQSTTPFVWESQPISFAEYKEAFDVVHKHLLLGNSYLANLTCLTPIQTNLSLKEIFYRSKAPYKLWVKDQFVVFSPEIFIRIQQGQISSYPMKGTIDASLAAADELLLTNPKEAAEHATIVDLIRNDLSMVATGVHVARYRYLESISTHRGPIWQTSSEIAGTLPSDYLSRIGEILFTLLPAGSITGAPKVKTTQIIAEAETYNRGYYTGITGYFDGTNLDSAVLIRFVEQVRDQLFFKSGGGITSQSLVEPEYNEMKQKVYVPIY